MTQSVQELLNTFDRLENSEKQEAITELLLRVRTIDFAPVSDDELVFAAEQVFLELDREESIDEPT